MTDVLAPPIVTRPIQSQRVSHAETGEGTIEETIEKTIEGTSLESLEWERSPSRKLWTRKECEILEQHGLLTRRYELIFGEIIFMAQNLPHKVVVMLITAWMMRVFGEAYIQAQMSTGVALGDAEINAPEPDVAALNVPLANLPGNDPMPADVALLVEVSDSTLRFDLRVKALLYARAGIVEYWVADVKGRRFIVHRNPTPTGYADITEHAADAEIAPLAKPDVRVRVADLLPSLETDVNASSL